jgi:hypothetical protein
LIVGFLGGFEKWDDPHRGVRKVALHLRSLNIPGVRVETIENHRQSLALPLLRSAGVSSDDRVRVILYGQSWGWCSRRQNRSRTAKDRRPGFALSPIDSVGVHDDLIPANVRAAANLYQHDVTGIQGRTSIRAEDPAATTLLENTRLSYLFRPYSTLGGADTSWTRRVFGGSHAKMEADSVVWEHVEVLGLYSIDGTL